MRYAQLLNAIIVRAMLSLRAISILRRRADSKQKPVSVEAVTYALLKAIYLVVISPSNSHVASAGASSSVGLCTSCTQYVSLVYCSLLMHMTQGVSAQAAGSKPAYCSSTAAVFQQRLANSEAAAVNAGNSSSSEEHNSSAGRSKSTSSSSSRRQQQQ
jgi:hypothetical protein